MEHQHLSLYSLTMGLQGDATDTQGPKRQDKKTQSCSLDNLAEALFLLETKS